MAPSVEAFQISLGAAEAYEAKFVPALFSEWAPYMVAAGGVASGSDVLDVACGTGVVARAAAAKVGPQGSVIGVDLNEAMLTVARRLSPEIDWRSGDAAALPFPSDSFDVVLCQAALMFFPDRVEALREMARVARPGGTVAVQVWADLADQPAYGTLVDVAAEHAGPEARDLLSAYWVLGDVSLLRSLFEAAGLAIVDLSTRTGTAAFDSIDEVVTVEVEATPLLERIDAATYENIRADARTALARYETASGTASLPIVGHIVVARVSG